MITCELSSNKVSCSPSGAHRGVWMMLTLTLASTSFALGYFASYFNNRTFSGPRNYPPRMCPNLPLGSRCSITRRTS